MKFKVGDYVYKPKGYSFVGVIRSVFTNTKGQVRIVAEMIGKNGGGMLHIYNESQLDHPHSWDEGMSDIAIALQDDYMTRWAMLGDRELEKEYEKLIVKHKESIKHE